MSIESTSDFLQLINSSFFQTNKSENFYGSGTGEQLITSLLIILSAYLSLVTTVYLCEYSSTILKLSNNLIAISAIGLFLQCCWFEIEIAVQEYTDSFCTVYTLVNVILATAMRTILYTVLWLRQRGIYNNPLQQMDGKKIKTLSRIVLAGILVFAVCQIVVLGIVPQYAIQGNCRSETGGVVVSILSPLVFTMSSLFQILLLGLTLYPVFKHIRGDSISNKNQKIAFVAKKLSICTAICVLADIIFVIITLNKPQEAPVSYIPVCYAFNTVVNTTATLFSFVNYSLRLWPFCKRIKEQISSPINPRSRPTSGSKIAVVAYSDDKSSIKI